MFYKKMIKIFFIVFLTSISFLAFVNYIVDPFQFFRKPTIFKPIFAKETYLNAGLIKNYDFDSIVIGSSMTENFILDEVKQYMGFDKPIKLSLGGGNMIEYNTFLNNAINKKDIKNILLGFDIFALDSAPSRLPLYLYDQNNINDLKYILNFDLDFSDQLILIVYNFLKECLYDIPILNIYHIYSIIYNTYFILIFKCAIIGITIILVNENMFNFYHFTQNYKISL